MMRVAASVGRSAPTAAVGATYCIYRTKFVIFFILICLYQVTNLFRHQPNLCKLRRTIQCFPDQISPFIYHSLGLFRHCLSVRTDPQKCGLWRCSAIIISVARKAQDGEESGIAQ